MPSSVEPAKQGCKRAMPRIEIQKSKRLSKTLLSKSLAVSGLGKNGRHEQSMQLPRNS
jgi:hypothetical protein